MKEETRKEIRQKMADYRQPAPEVSWEVLEETLAKNKSAKTAPLWPRRLAVAAGVLLLAGIGWQVLKENHPMKEPMVATIDHQTVQHPKTPTSERNAENVEESSATAVNIQTTTLIASRQQPSTTKSEQQTSQSLLAEAFIPADEAKTTETTETSESTESTEISNASDAPKDDTTQQQDNKNNQQQISTPQPISYPSDHTTHFDTTEDRLIAKVYLSNMMVGNNNPNSISPMMDAAVPYDSPISEIPTMYENSSYYPSPEIEETIHHRQPIRFGLSLRYQFTRRWSVEGGLSYTYLSSDITHKANGYSYKTEQKLTYIGIPINANYQIWGNKHFSVYATAGGIVEKMVKGKREKQTTIGGYLSPTLNEDVSIRPLQFSLTCGAGADVHLSRIFSLYAEPEITYHFDNHSSIPTFYQDKPFGFNLNVGLRLNLNR